MSGLLTAIDLDCGWLMGGVVGEPFVPAVIVGIVDVGDGSP
jgi:hypothetical protein